MQATTYKKYIGTYKIIILCVALQGCHEMKNENEKG